MHKKERLTGQPYAVEVGSRLLALLQAAPSPPAALEVEGNAPGVRRVNLPCSDWPSGESIASDHSSLLSFCLCTNGMKRNYDEQMSAICSPVH